jgi:hypothetical protein
MLFTARRRNEETSGARLPAPPPPPSHFLLLLLHHELLRGSGLSPASDWKTVPHLNGASYCTYAKKHSKTYM